MDGVLVDAMPLHYQAMKSAIKELTNIDLDVRICHDFYMCINGVYFLSTSYDLTVDYNKIGENDKSQ
jgi:hypothetical protein